MCVQIKVLCTSRRATMVVVAVSLGALTVQIIRLVVGYFHNAAVPLIKHIYTIVFGVVVQVTVLVVNLTVVCEVRRASNNAVVNLGLQQHHQSTSSNSAVPTVMLITTSLLYVLLTVPASILYVVIAHIPDSVWCSVTWRRTLNIVIQSRMVSAGLYHVVFAYNFFVYLITGKQFRSELRQLCSSCSSANNNEPAIAVRIPPHGQAVTNV